MSLIPIEVVYDVRARDGSWCAKPSKDYINGCPNFKGFCKKNGKSLNFSELERQKGPFKWYAVVEEFNIAAWEASQSEKHKGENWTRKQLRNPRHWQKGVENRLRDAALKYINYLMGDVLLYIPEAHGVNVIETMVKVGVTFEWGLNAKVFKKVMFVGKKEIAPSSLNHFDG